LTNGQDKKLVGRVWQDLFPFYECWYGAESTASQLLLDRQLSSWQE